MATGPLTITAEDVISAVTIPEMGIWVGIPGFLPQGWIAPMQEATNA
jgi:hypothetical protein